MDQNHTLSGYYKTSPSYIMVPRDIIYDVTLSDKRAIIFCYLYTRRAFDNTVAFSTTELCHWSKLNPNYRDGGINQKYYYTLSMMAKRGFFKSYPDFESLMKEGTNSKKYRYLTVNPRKFNIDSNFGFIYYDELEKILNFKEELKDKGIDLKRISSSYILLLLAYLRINMNRNEESPYCCYRLYTSIADDIQISKRYIGKIVEILDALKIIKSVPCKRIKYITYEGQEKHFTSPKVFTDYRRYVKDENGTSVIDIHHNPDVEIAKQIELLYSQTEN